MSEHRGPWREVSRCTQCGLIIAKDIKWMHRDFVPVCPSCGARNTNGGFLGSSDLFDSVVAREVRVGLFRRLVRWEFKDEENPDAD